MKCDNVELLAALKRSLHACTQSFARQTNICLPRPVRPPYGLLYGVYTVGLSGRRFVRQFSAPPGVVSNVCWCVLDSPSMCPRCVRENWTCTNFSDRTKLVTRSPWYRPSDGTMVFTIYRAVRRLGRVPLCKHCIRCHDQNVNHILRYTIKMLQSTYLQLCQFVSYSDGQNICISRSQLMRAIFWPRLGNEEGHLKNLILQCKLFERLNALQNTAFLSVRKHDFSLLRVSENERNKKAILTVGWSTVFSY